MLYIAVRKKIILNLLHRLEKMRPLALLQLNEKKKSFQTFYV